MKKISHSYSDIYNGYFNAKNPFITNLEEIYQKPVQIPIYSLDELFTDQALEDISVARRIEKDIVVLKQLENSKKRIRTFQYRGKRYVLQDSSGLIGCLERELKALYTEIEKRDFDIFKYFHFIAARKFQIEPLKDKYRAYHRVARRLEHQTGLCTNLFRAITKEDISSVNVIEQDFKEELKVILENDDYRSEISEKIKYDLQNYLLNSQLNFNILLTAADNFNFIVQSTHLKLKKILLDFQAQLEESLKINVLNTTY